ncbi:MAG: hypothetical protein K0Q72_1102 [Armatimonadetes bacterium]|nr:hypothetical protein [Armatimonadota bacterium]
MQQIDMSGQRLETPLVFGCIRIDYADTLKLSELVLMHEHHELGITLWGDYPGPTDKVSLVSVSMFRLPEAADAFAEAVKWFARDRRVRSPKLPDGVAFNDQTLAPARIEGIWTHDAFATNPRSIVHVYTTAHLGVQIRYLAKSGTLLDHPLLSRVCSNLTLDANLWCTDEPLTAATSVTQVVECPLPPDVQEEVGQLLRTGRDWLGLTAQSSALESATAVDEMLEKLPRGKKVADATPERTLQLAVVWAEALCRECRWEWVQVGATGDEEYVIVSPDRSLMIEPMAYVQGVRSSKRTENTALLLFNMITAANVPRAPAQSYTPIS